MASRRSQGAPGGRVGPFDLAAAVAAATRRALACGALEPIETVCEELEEAGVRFLVRHVSSLARKEALRRRVALASGERRPARDPFAAPAPALRVGAIGRHHVALLNKFPVLDHHLLVVTRDFAPQEAPLDAADCGALAACLAAVDGLAFYNGGAIAGASQAHKHLQLVPLPLAPGGPAVPVQPWLDTAPRAAGAVQVPALPFAHGFARLEAGEAADGGRLHERYRTLLEAAGVRLAPDPAGVALASPYDLLATRRWMLVVPRIREDYHGISLNALGFAGSLFVRDDAQRQRLRRDGPLAALRAVAAPRA